jgi:Lrp/AsnC family leucine-responsive transcriptional regulator
MGNVDDIDRRIVGLLAESGRLSHEQIAREVHLSRPAVHERVRRLEERGVIRGYQARVDWDALGQPVAAFIWLRTTGAQGNAIGRAILGLGDANSVVEECYRVTGEWCMLVKVRVASTRALQDLIDRIRSVSGVVSTVTAIAMSDLSMSPAHPASVP